MFLVYESEVVGFNGSFFYNVVVWVMILKSIEEVCVIFKVIEKDNGRVYIDKKFCVRIFDFDLFIYDSKVIIIFVVLFCEEICYNVFVFWLLVEFVFNDIYFEM